MDEGQRPGHRHVRQPERPRDHGVVLGGRHLRAAAHRGRRSEHELRHGDGHGVERRRQDTVADGVGLGHRGQGQEQGHHHRHAGPGGQRPGGPAAGAAGEPVGEPGQQDRQGRRVGEGLLQGHGQEELDQHLPVGDPGDRPEQPGGVQHDLDPVLQGEDRQAEPQEGGREHQEHRARPGEPRRLGAEEQEERQEGGAAALHPQARQGRPDSHR